MSDLKAPFGYSGGKSLIADDVWVALGDVKNYVEPFAGSAAVLLARPQPFEGTETINDANGYVSNFWRAVQADPDAVAKHADWPVLENDLHARHQWLWARRDDLRKKLEDDPDWYDAKIAGWWAWGMSTWAFHGSWCTDIPRRAKPMCAGGTKGNGLHSVTQDPVERLRALQARLRRVRVLCGDWIRPLTHAVITVNNSPEITGIFLDPPYSHEDRDSRVYGKDDDPDLFDKVVAWAFANANETNRIVLAGYDSRPMPEGWREVQWTGHGGHGRRSHGENTNFERERLWLSPQCIVRPPLPTSMEDILGI
jgi:site-specific DNA-adenine methylase